LLDPYGLHLDWRVIEAAGRMRSIEILLNFPILDMNRNVLRRDVPKVDPSQVARMNRCWGDESWRAAAYTTEENLFGFEEKTANETMVEAFRRRMKEVAGFAHVSDGMPMRNSSGATVYYLLFASQKPVAKKIVSCIFKKHADRRK
jgi:three-Cys-motif partner protein